MAGEWEYAPLDEIVDDIVDRRGITPLKLGSKFVAHGFRVISAKAIKGCRVDLSVDEPRFVDEDTYCKWMKSPLRADDVIITSEAPLGELAYLSDDVEWCLGQRLFALRTKKTRLNGRFLFYALQSEQVRHDLFSRATGTTAQGIRQTELRLVRIPLPGIDEQRAIAHILGTLDDKIELNRKMNETLEAMARALFKSWFVDFDPVRAKAEGRDTGLPKEIADLFPDSFQETLLGPIPHGWRACKLSDIAKNVSIAFNFDRTPEVVFINTGDVLEGDFLHSKRSAHACLPGQAKKSIQPDDILLSEIRPANKHYAYVDFDSSDYVVSTKFMIIRGSKDICPRLLYRILTAKETIDEFQIQAESRSGTFPQITFDSISYLPIVLPSIDVQRAFQLAVDNLDIKIKANKQQSSLLASLRGVLLPKLISGEVRVKDAECYAEKET